MIAFQTYRRSASFAGSFVALLCLAPAALAKDAGAPKDDKQGAPSTCIHWHHEARYSGFGYDHVVHIDNGCGSAVACEVRTDVNPETLRVRVPPRRKVEVLTFRGSPARMFTPQVECKQEN